MDSLSERVTASLHGLFNSEMVSFDLLDPSAVQWNTVVVAPAIAEWPAMFEILQHHAHEHPIVNHALRNSDPHAIRTSDLLSLRQYRQLGLYHDLFRAHLGRMDRQLGFVTRTPGALTMGVSINQRGRDFSTEQRALLDLLRPHLLRAYVSARAQARLLERLATTREQVGLVAGGGLCEVDAEGRINWATSAVEPLLRRYFPQERRGRESLPEPLAGMVARQVRALRNRDGQGIHTRQTWQVLGVQGSLTIHLTARPANGAWHFLLMEEPTEPTAPALAAKHGLTKRESQVLYWIGQGKTNEEAGVILGMAARTVGKHTERLFNKLEVTNRTAAARIALGK